MRPLYFQMQGGGNPSLSFDGEFVSTLGEGMEPGEPQPGVINGEI